MSHPHSLAPSAHIHPPNGLGGCHTHPSAQPVLYTGWRADGCVACPGANGRQARKLGGCFQERAERLRQLLSIPGIRLASSMEGARNDKGNSATVAEIAAEGGVPKQNKRSCFNELP